MLKDSAAGVIFVLLLISSILLLGWYCDTLIGEKATLKTEKRALDEKNAIVTAQLDAARSERDALSKKLRAAEKAGQTTRAATQQRVVRIYTQPVPSDCEGAARWAATWGIEKGHSWAVQ